MTTRKDLVNEFMTTAEVVHAMETHLMLVREEAKELIEAAHNLLKEAADFQYVVNGLLLQCNQEEVDASVDEETEELTARALGVIDLIPPQLLDIAFMRVHESNMSKLVDGKAERDPETGKILKGPNYVKPDFSDII